MNWKKRKRRKADRVFGALLCFFLMGMAASAIAYALGWEDGLLAVLFFAGMANIPLFHFAMNWPLRDSNKSEPCVDDQPGTAPEPKSGDGGNLDPEAEAPPE